MSADKQTTSPSCGSGASPAAGASAPCPLECAKKVFPAREVSHSVTETIVAPPGKERWNITATWDAKYTINASRDPCSVKVTVKIKIVGTITEPQKTGWKSAIEAKWNGKVKLVCPDPACAAACPNGYPVSFDVQFVTSGEHYVVNANNNAATAGVSVTPDMGTWGVNDTVDVTHEFGHMLGAPEEYFKTNGTDYGEGRQAGHPVMNNPAGNPVPRNYSIVTEEAGKAMGITCTSSAA